MSYNFLDKTGLTYFYDKIKTIFAKKSEIPTKTSQLTNDSAFNSSSDVTAGTIDTLAAFTSGKPGRTGSISLTKKSSGVGSEIPAGWYNYYFAPHRTGTGGDNDQYGTILLTPMNFAGKSWILRRSNSANAISEVKSIITNDLFKTSLITNDAAFIKNSAYYINIHPENSPVLIPFIHNDIAFLLKRGGSAKIYYDNVETSLDISNVFDGSGSYWAINPTGVTQIIIELTLHQTFSWTNTIYFDFGAAGWRAKHVKIEVMNTNYSQDVWTQKYNNTNNGSGNGMVVTSHQPVGASNQGGGFNKVRFTFDTWNTATIFRISQLGIYNYGSKGVRETYMSRGIDDYIFRNITPNSNNTYNLGSSSNKWANVYATTFNGNATSATKATGDKNGNDITTTYQPKLTPGSNITITNNTIAATIPSNIAKTDSHNTFTSQANEFNGTIILSDYNNPQSGKATYLLMDSADGFEIILVNNSEYKTYTFSKDGNINFNNQKNVLFDADLQIINYIDSSIRITDTLSDISGNSSIIYKLSTNTRIFYNGISGNDYVDTNQEQSYLVIFRNYIQSATATWQWNWFLIYPNQSDIYMAKGNTTTSSGTLSYNNSIPGNSGDTTPVGVIQQYAGSTAPTGYLMCDGSAISRTDYADLFAVIGTTYGTGDGQSTFNLPNIKGKVPVGLDIADSDFNSLGKTGGNKNHNLDINGIYALANPTGLGVNYTNAAKSFSTDYWVDASTSRTKGGGGRSNTNAGIKIGGTLNSGNNMSPFIVLNYIIKA